MEFDARLMIMNAANSDEQGLASVSWRERAACHSNAGPSVNAPCVPNAIRAWRGKRCRSRQARRQLEHSPSRQAAYDRTTDQTMCAWRALGASESASNALRALKGCGDRSPQEMVRSYKKSGIGVKSSAVQRGTGLPHG